MQQKNQHREDLDNIFFEAGPLIKQYVYSNEEDKILLRNNMLKLIIKIIDKNKDIESYYNELNDLKKSLINSVIFLSRIIKD